HFPRSRNAQSASFVKEEKKLMLPLVDDGGSLLGIFVARGVTQKEAAPLVAAWPALGALITDNVLLYKRSLCDPATGLFSRHYLLRCMEREIDMLREPFLPEPRAATAGKSSTTGRSAPKILGNTRENSVSGSGEARSSSIGTLIVRLAALKDIVKEFGYQFADDLMTALADALVENCPEQALAARTGDSEFAVLLPSASAKSCRHLATEIVQALRQVSLEHTLSGKRIGLHASVGYTLYPHDMSGSLFMRPSQEQARLVLRKARLAAALADDNLAESGAEAVEDSIMAFGTILSDGGRVLEVLPLSRVMVSLGTQVHAREGQRFSLWEPQRGQSGKTGLSPLYKGEIVLMDVHENISQAEVIHLGDPGVAIAPGDHLVLMPEEQGSQAKAKGNEGRRDSATGLLRHGDFLAEWAEHRDSAEGFSLALVRLAPKPDNEFGDLAPNADNPARFMAEAVNLCLEDLAALPGQNAMFGGRYGLNSLIFYHPGAFDNSLATKYEALSSELSNRLGLDVAVGIAPHPCLDFRKADALENCRKALEYGMLLPEPHVGVLDTLALNISADKRFSQGDTFGAIREYQRALLADEKNGMAWNSLGICLAGLNRHSEAERHFSRALDCNADDAMALYNLGFMHQSQNRPDEAKNQYTACLAKDPGHLFAIIRLGQLAESRGNAAEAREMYEKAAGLPGGEGLTFRHFARLCISEGKPDEAREHLHEALLHDPQDALAMGLLARLYLDAEEDPEMAASFARQSVSLRPELKSVWLQLARALDALGRDKEGREARLKAV
ncbi:diguanylate cyclase, partial [Desulfovibrio sp. OttesenSCG-928-G15]|nr:diguanylate cyclase [Desulfovibrio sp. OttesenSCG-928-G15]